MVTYEIRNYAWNDSSLNVNLWENPYSKVSRSSPLSDRQREKRKRKRSIASKSRRRNRKWTKRPSRHS